MSRDLTSVSGGVIGVIGVIWDDILDFWRRVGSSLELWWSSRRIFGKRRYLDAQQSFAFDKLELMSLRLRQDACHRL